MRKQAPVMVSPVMMNLVMMNLVMMNLAMMNLVMMTVAAVALTEAHAQPSSSDLVKALQGGGCVLAIRHARSPREAPTRETANADNTRLERQLDEEGRRGATEMGNALRALRIPGLA